MLKVQRFLLIVTIESSKQILTRKIENAHGRASSRYPTQAFGQSLLPMTRTFDPQEHVFRSPAYRSAVKGAVRFFIKTPALQLPPPRQFPGGGVYALYYAGSGEPYPKLGSMNRVNLVCPIYVGKAVPPGWRTARSNREETGSVFLKTKGTLPQYCADAKLDYRRFSLQVYYHDGR